MAKYLIKRLLHGLLSVIAVVAIIMVLVYSTLDRNRVFAQDSNWTKLAQNDREVYKYQKWEEYGYLDYVPYTDYIRMLINNGDLSEEDGSKAAKFGKKRENDEGLAREYVTKFYGYYGNKGYKIVRLNAIMINNTYVNGGQEKLFAYKDIPLITRLWRYLTNVITIDNIHYVERTTGKKLENTGIRFTFFDPVYNTDENGNLVKKVFSPAIIGTGTQHKYLLYFDNKFPFIHQNLINFRLGTSYSVNQGVDVWDTMTRTQGAYVQTETVFPTGYKANRAENLHTVTYVAGSAALNSQYYKDDYTNAVLNLDGKSKVGYSFSIGIIAVIISYLLAVPLGIMMARHKDGLLDKIGTLYIVFIIAVPSLAYIFMFRAIGGAFGLPTTFRTDLGTKLIYILPIISLALPSVAGLMKWLRRYMIDQSNADYVKFARSGGLSKGEIFRKHILKNAAIPIIHGIPGSVLGAIVGAIITERIYVVPGAGALLTDAISAFDNGVIVGLAMFYALLSVLSIILGDILMAMVDPRISFTNKER